MTHEPFTIVIIAYRKNRINHRLLFGEPAFIVRRGWRRSLACFCPNRIFGYERWRGDQHGTQDWRLYICLTVGEGAVTSAPGILPGADLLLTVRGKTRVKQAFSAFGTLNHEFGKLENVPPAHWRNLHNALQIGHSEKAESNAKVRVI